MKTLYLVRHAEASPSNPLIKDYNRPLRKSGCEDAQKMGLYLKSKQLIPDYILCSASKRTQETTTLLLDELFPIDYEKSIYGAALNEMLIMITSINNQYHSAMIIGHNPTITFLVNHLSDAIIDYIPTCGVAIIQFHCTSWLEIKENGKLIDFISPKKLTLL